MGTEFTAAREATKGFCNFFITGREPIQIRLLEDYLTVVDFYLKTKRSHSPLHTLTSNPFSSSRATPSLCPLHFASQAMYSWLVTKTWLVHGLRVMHLFWQHALRRLTNRISHCHQHLQRSQQGKVCTINMLCHMSVSHTVSLAACPMGVDRLYATLSAASAKRSTREACTIDMLRHYSLSHACCPTAGHMGLSDQTVSSVCREINMGGLPMLYEIITEIAGPEFKCALEVRMHPQPNFQRYECINVRHACLL